MAGMPGGIGGRKEGRKEGRARPKTRPTNTSEYRKCTRKLPARSLHITQRWMSSSFRRKAGHDTNGANLFQSPRDPKPNSVP